MPERDLILQLDQALDAILSGAKIEPAGPEVAALLRIAAHLRAVPNEEFRASLKRDLMAEAMKERKNMTGTVNWIREGFRTLTPYLLASSAAGLITFLRDTFGAEEKFRMPRPDGTIMHSEFRIGDSMLELAEVPADFVGPRATALRAFVPDVDAVYRRALEAGGTSLYEPVDQGYGEREAGLKDPAGNYWFLTRHLRAEYKDPGVPDVAPWVFARGASSFIEFLEKAFGGEVLERHQDPGGAVLHADVKLGDSVLSMGEAHGQWQPMPGAIHFYSPDVDAMYQRAIEAGATSISAPANTPYGDRYAGVIDPQGNYWYLATHIGDAT
jgi:PhnB protein